VMFLCLFLLDLGILDIGHWSLGLGVLGFAGRFR
jgi:hypothetical protein